MAAESYALLPQHADDATSSPEAHAHARLHGAAARHQFAAGVLVGALCALLIAFVAGGAQPVSVARVSAAEKRRAMARAFESMRSEAPTYYECALQNMVGCCKQLPGNGTAAKFQHRWYTQECDSFEDGTTCCYIGGSMAFARLARANTQL